MPVYYIKDRLTNKPWSDDPRWNDQNYKDKLKPERDRLNNQFCSEKKTFRYVIGEMK
jgi:hypothetical protein